MYKEPSEDLVYAGDGQIKKPQKTKQTITTHMGQLAPDGTFYD